MILVKGRNGIGFRFIYPWFRKSGRAVSAFQLPESRHLLLYAMLSASIIVLVAVSSLRERSGHLPEADGVIYLIAFTILLVELAWKITHTWRPLTIDAATLEPLPYSSRLNSEHVFFWVAMSQSIIAMDDHYHLAHAGIRNAVSIACVLFMLLPLFNRLLLRLYLQP